MWPAFKRYFVTAWLATGIAMSIRLFRDEGWIGALIGFFGVIPFMAPLALGRAWYVMRHPEAELPDPPIRWVRVISIGLGIGVLFWGSLIMLKIYW